VLDALLEQIVEEGRSVDEIVAAGGDRALADRVMRLVRGSEYKRKQMPPGLIVTRKAFGPGRRYPIAAK
jgi:NAD+ synthase (glutamine-hydrolysing)